MRDDYARQQTPEIKNKDIFVYACLRLLHISSFVLDISHIKQLGFLNLKVRFKCFHSYLILGENMKIKNLLEKISTGEIKKGDYIDLILRENNKITFLGNGIYDKAIFNDITLRRLYFRKVIGYYPEKDKYDDDITKRIQKNTVLNYDFMTDSTTLSNAIDSIEKDSGAFLEFKTKIKERKAILEEEMEEVWDNP